MDIKRKMNGSFRPIQGGLFQTVTKADVGDGVAKFQAAGGEIMAWADPSIPQSVKDAMQAALESGMPGLRQTLMTMAKEKGLC